MNYSFDLGVIGAGPGGYSAALSAARAGLKTVIFEDTRTGGTCLNVGCIPTKYLLSAASDLDRIRGMEEAGMLRDAGAFSFKSIQRNKTAAIEKLASGIEHQLASAGVKRVQGTASLRPGRIIEAASDTYECAKVIIATGSSPVMLKLPGAEYMGSSTDALSLTKVPERLVCIGGGVIGLEMAGIFASLGSEVTVVEAMERLCPNDLQPAAELLTRSLEAKGIKICVNTALKSISKANNGYIVACESNGNEISFTADFVLCAVGRKPNLRGIDAAPAGLELNRRGGIVTDSHMRTSADGIYAIGDCTAGIMLAHTAYAMADAAVADILGQELEYDPSVLPRCIYTKPGFAAVGVSDTEAREAGYEPVIGRAFYSYSGMALAERAQDGCVYAVCDKKTSQTLGFFIVGADAHELIAAAQLAVEKKYTRDDWQRHISAHPTLSEMLKEAALDATK